MKTTDVIPFLQEKTIQWGKSASDYTQAVLDAGKELWKTYFSMEDEYQVRERLKLNRPDVGWYQIRMALQARNDSGIGQPTDFTPFKTAYQTLTDKLSPEVYRKGFLKS